MNKITEIFIEHCVNGELWPLMQDRINRISRYSRVFSSVFLDSIYDDITWVYIRKYTEPRIQPLLIDLIDLAFDEIDEKEFDAAVIEKIKEQKESELL